IALTGHSGIHTAQSMHSSGSIARKVGPSRKQSTGHTSTQSVYLQRMQDSVTTWVMAVMPGAAVGPRYGSYRDHRFPTGHGPVQVHDDAGGIASVSGRTGRV